MTTKISWTNETWNPVVGCSRISPGCRGCYAHRMAKRQAGMARAKRAQGKDPGRSAHYEKVENWDGVALVPEALGDPLRWRKARRVFVCSMADLFHEDVPDSYIAHVFEVMEKSRRHTFQLLTKRPERMRDYIKRNWDRMDQYLTTVHVGATIENQDQMHRLQDLVNTPAAFHFVSHEPLLSEIDYRAFPLGPRDGPSYGVSALELGLINLCIVGGETGPGARPMDVKWARDIRDQCRSAGVAFHFKQMSKRAPIPDDLMIRELGK